MIKATDIASLREDVEKPIAAADEVPRSQENYKQLTSFGKYRLMGNEHLYKEAGAEPHGVDIAIAAVGNIGLQEELGFNQEFVDLTERKARGREATAFQGTDELFRPFKAQVKAEPTPS